MSAKAQPYIHKFIADTIFDFEEGDEALDGFDLFTLFMMLKTTTDVMNEITPQPATALSFLA